MSCRVKRGPPSSSCWYLTSLDILRVYLISIGRQWVNILYTGQVQHPLYDESLMVLVLFDINMRLETSSTTVKSFNLTMASEEERREVEEIDRIARR
jgi:hypothetical protein